MTTRRERLAERIEKRRQWADKAKDASTAAYDRAHAILERIPPGQPILVGHHSEKHHRADLKRIDNAMAQSLERQHMAERHESKADGIERQLEHSIFSDDSDAVEALERRIAYHERMRQHMKNVNALYRKGDAEQLAKLGFDLTALREKLKTAYSWCQQPYPGYELQNLGQRIQADKKRLEQVKQQQARHAQAEAAPNGVTLDHVSGNEYCRVTFAEKPERTILQLLRAGGYSWGGGSWVGKWEQLPEEVRAMLANPEEA